MPKVKTNRERRERQRATAGNLHRESKKPTKTAYTDAYRKLRRYRIAGTTLMVLGVLMALAHVYEHLADVAVLPSFGLRDLLIGFPMAGVLFVIGLVLAGRQITK